MAKLADVTAEIRTIGKILGISLAIITVIFLFFKGGEIFKNVFFPTPPPPPAQKFGRLPQVAFPGNSPTGLTFRVNTLTGKLPATGSLPGEIPDRMKVYKVKPAVSSLVALDGVRNNLQDVGFDTNETKLSDSIYQWNNSTGTNIKYNIINNDFGISSSYLTDPPPAALFGVIAQKDGAYDSAIDFLQGINEDVSDLDQTKTTASYLKLDNGALVGASSLNDAQFIRVDLFQKSVDNYSIYYPGLTKSNMYFIYRNGDNGPSIVEALFTHSEVNSDESSDYPIKTADQAFEDLSHGNAYVITTQKSTSIDITDVSLGYYMGDEKQQYFLPIFVFKGDGFTAFVNAVSTAQ
ncbi:MAG TPA: hypothetical protein VG965_04795 [Patescibacteria group bacterium]|nr:hypothetical protein [Patescibacteria group bacterium]